MKSIRDLGWTPALGIGVWKQLMDGQTLQQNRGYMATNEELPKYGDRGT